MTNKRRLCGIRLYPGKYRGIWFKPSNPGTYKISDPICRYVCDVCIKKILLSVAGSL